MKWCNHYNCWCEDVESIIDEPDCNLLCKENNYAYSEDDCEYVEHVQVC